MEARLDATTPDRRSQPRYPVDIRIFASIDGQTVCLNNISEQGVAIHGSGLSTGSAHLLEMNINHVHVTVSVEILECSGNGLLHARFVEPPDDAQRLIRSYITELI